MGRLRSIVLKDARKYSTLFYGDGIMARRIRCRDFKRSRNIRKMKIPLLVVSAIKNLRNTNGTTPNKIVNYVARVNDISKSSVKRRVDVALKRAVNYGVLRCKRGHYFLDIDSPFLNYARVDSGSSSRRRSGTINRNSMTLKKVKRSRRRVEPLCTVVRKPLLSIRKISKNTRSRSSPHQLSDMYCNPSYKANSTDSSNASTVSRKSSDLQEMCDIVQDEQ